MKASKKKLRNKIINSVGFGLAVVVTYWWAYLLYTGTPSCDAHGIKLAVVIVPICLVLGNKIAATVPFLIGSFAAYMLVSSINEKI
tara:strand:- start:624 stop:881 length:258 start_codon:yes stop_codon:yes gene_type:complete